MGILMDNLFDGDIYYYILQVQFGCLPRFISINMTSDVCCDTRCLVITHHTNDSQINIG